MRALSSLIGLVVALMMGEGLVVVYANYVAGQEQMDAGLIQYDARYGWKLSANWTGRHQHFDYGAEYHTDQFGMRKSAAQKASVNRRVLVLGDSFTFGLGVNDDETFVSILNGSQEEVRYINAGVPGFSPDQQILWMNAAIKMSLPDEILFVVYLGNDLIDLGRPYPLQAEYAKPYVTMDETGQLNFANLPVPAARKPDSIAELTLQDIVLPGSERRLWSGSRLVALLRENLTSKNVQLEPELTKHMQPSLALFNALLVRLATEQGPLLRFVLLPGASLVKKPGSLSARYQQLVREKLAYLIQAQGFEVIDLTPALLGHTAPAYFPNDGHLTTDGHRLVAGALLNDPDDRL